MPGLQQDFVGAVEDRRTVGETPKTVTPFTEERPMLAAKSLPALRRPRTLDPDQDLTARRTGRSRDWTKSFCGLGELVALDGRRVPASQSVRSVRAGRCVQA